jgi:hypothetical protein
LYLLHVARIHTNRDGVTNGFDPNLNYGHPLLEGNPPFERLNVAQKCTVLEQVSSVCRLADSDICTADMEARTEVKCTVLEQASSSSSMRRLAGCNTDL